MKRLGRLRYTSKFSVTPKQVFDGILTNESFVGVNSPRLAGRDHTVEQLIGALEKVGVNKESME